MGTIEKNGVEKEIDLLAMLNWIWKRRLSFFAFVALGSISFVAYSYMVPKQYSATVVLLPQIPVQKAGILGPLAALTDETIALEGVDEALYGWVLHSNLLLNKVVKLNWPGAGSRDSVSLYDVFGLSDLVVEKGQLYANHVLKGILRTQVIRFERDPKIGVMKIVTTVPENPDLAASLANYLAIELEIFNRKLINQRSIKTRDFVAIRLLEIQAKLEVAEAEITQFLKNNERYRSSPNLLQKYGELDREVQAYKSIWLQLRSQFENANIEVNKDIDSINILDMATPSFHRSSPIRWMYLLAGAFLGFMIAIVYGKIRQIFDLRKA